MKKRRLLRVMSIAAAALPFAFASIRAVQTGSDFRYFWLAFAGLFGAAVTVGLGRGTNSGRSTLALAAAAFAVATLLSTLTAMLIGTRLGPGLLVVAGSFSWCFAAGALLHLLARV